MRFSAHGLLFYEPASYTDEHGYEDKHVDPRVLSFVISSGVEGSLAISLLV